MSAYYNEHDAYAAAWLRNLIAAGLIAPGDVDTRSIVDVSPDDLRGYTQVHLFAGIGGWSYAARLAGWPDDRPLWTGSCPCQPFSSAGKRQGADDDRHLWPEMFRLLRECRPRAVFGEQVASARAWIDGVCDDMEAVGYSCWPSVLPACGVGADHVRYRIFFACYPNGDGEPSIAVHDETSGVSRSRGLGRAVASADGLPHRMGDGDAYRVYGNAIVPQVAAEFLRAYMEASSHSLPPEAQTTTQSLTGAG